MIFKSRESVMGVMASKDSGLHPSYYYLEIQALLVKAASQDQES